MNFEQRLETIRQELAKLDSNVLLVSSEKNRQYLSGFDGSSGWLLLTEDKHLLITDGRYWDQVGRQSPGAELVKFVAAKHKDMVGALLPLLEPLQKQGVLKLAVETDDMTLTTFRKLQTELQAQGIEFKESQNLVSKLRQCKDQDEINLLKRAAEIADEALAKALEDFRPGLRECDLKAEIEYHLLRLGASGTSFSTIVASGPNGSYPHAGASTREIQEGELITVDFGASYQAYCSDMTRTIWYGTLPEKELELLSAVREAQVLALSAVKAGVKASLVDAAARNHLTKLGFGEYFLHSLGHGVGLNIHEEPGLKSTNDEPLLAGQIITIEPGVYLPGQTGCRVEDTVLVTEDSYEILNHFPKQSLHSTAPPNRVSKKAVSPSP